MQKVECKKSEKMKKSKKVESTQKYAKKIEREKK